MQFKMIHENYNVADLAVSIPFYEEALGLHEVRRKEAQDGSFIIVYLANDASDFELELTVKGDGVEVGNRPGGGALRSPSGLYHTIDHAVGNNGQRHRRYFQRCLLVLLSHGKSTNAQHHHGDMTYPKRQSLLVLFI